MNTLENVNQAAYLPKAHENRTTAPARTALRLPSTPGDSVEFSHLGVRLAQSDDLTSVRADRIDRVRREIESGTYETDQKLQITLEKLYADLGSLDIRA